MTSRKKHGRFAGERKVWTKADYIPDLMLSVPPSPPVFFFEKLYRKSQHDDQRNLIEHARNRARLQAQKDFARAAKFFDKVNPHPYGTKPYFAWRKQAQYAMDPGRARHVQRMARIKLKREHPEKLARQRKRHYEKHRAHKLALHKKLRGFDEYRNHEAAYRREYEKTSTYRARRAEWYYRNLDRQRGLANQRSRSYDEIKRGLRLANGTYKAPGSNARTRTRDGGGRFLRSRAS